MNRMGWKARLWCGILALGVSLTVGCGYGAVGDKAYELATALHSICNTKSVTRLDKFRQVLDEEKKAGTLTAQEIRWIDDIVSDASNQDWESAAKKSRRLMLDQVDD